MLLDDGAEYDLWLGRGRARGWGANHWSKLMTCCLRATGMLIAGRR